jgi:hypothetical protein
VLCAVPSGRGDVRWLLVKRDVVSSRCFVAFLALIPNSQFGVFTFFFTPSTTSCDGALPPVATFVVCLYQSCFVLYKKGDDMNEASLNIIVCEQARM